MQISQAVIERFLSRVNVDSQTGCWEWTGSKASKGYGRLHFMGEVIYAHRLSHLIYKGDIPNGLFVCHSCDNPGCVNPEHIWAGTGRDNAIDRERKQRRPIVNRGSNNFFAKLSADDVRSIRQRAVMGGRGIQARLAREFGVKRSTISAIALRRSWDHIE